MGPNGSGKSTLAKVLMGQPGYLTTAGKLFFDGRELLDYITPDVVHVMVDGRIVRSGGPEVALWLEEEGYASWREVEERAAAI